MSKDPSKENRIRYVVQVAKSLFIRHGYSATSTSQIAREAGISEMTLFRYFTTKRELFEAVIAPLIKINWFPAVCASEQELTKSSVLGLLRERFSFVRQERELVRLVIIESQLQPELAGDYNPVAKVFSQLQELLTGFGLNKETCEVIINLIMGLFLTIVFTPRYKDEVAEATFQLIESQIMQLFSKGERP